MDITTGEGGIRVHRAEGITHLHVSVPFGKDSMGNFSSTFRHSKGRYKWQAHRRSSAQFLVADYTTLRSETTGPEFANNIILLMPF